MVLDQGGGGRRAEGPPLRLLRHREGVAPPLSDHGRPLRPRHRQDQRWEIRADRIVPEAHLKENPKLADMAKAAIKVLSADPSRPFALFIEGGRRRLGPARQQSRQRHRLHVYSGEDAVRAVIAWVEKHSNWDDSALIVTSDHGHYMVLDDPKALTSDK